MLEQQRLYTSEIYEIYGIYDPRNSEEVVVFEIIDKVSARIAYISGDMGARFIDASRRIITDDSSVVDDENFLH